MLVPLLAVSVEDADAATLPTGFVEEVVLDGLDSPATFEFAQDGRIFVAEQGGKVKVFDSVQDATSDVVADLSPAVQHFWDRGMLGMALDPDFPNNPHIYVLYTYDYNPASDTHDVPDSWGDGCANPPGATSDGCVVMARLSRLVIDGTTTATQEDVLIEDWCQQYPSHSIGQLAFGPDGALYASAGDGASFNFADYGQEGEPINPCDDPPTGRGGTQSPPTAEGGALRSQDLQTSGDPVTLDGTVIRIDPVTGDGMPDNPLATHSDANARRIVAYGLRNPFRFDIRPATNEVWLGDVGWNTWEEINRITDPTAGPTNFGWPCYEGQNRQPGYDNLNLDICENLYAQPTGDPGAHTHPYFAYRHGQGIAGESCSNNSSSISGIAFQFYQGGNYPSEYDDALFFSDYSRNCIWVMKKGSGTLPAPGLIEPFVEFAAGPVDLQIGPGGDLYYADLAPQDPVGGTIRRIRYDPDAPPPVTDCDAATGTDLVGVDIGSPAVAGSAEFANGVWTVSGSGADIWHTSDSFHFACQPLTGDGTITARVGSQTNTDPWAKAGVMMRASTAPNATHAMVVVTPGKGVAFQYRSSSGGSSTHVAGPSKTTPQWVRLIRSGDTLTGETSTDGTAWTTIGSTTVPLGSDPRTGLAVTSHNDGALSTATFDNLDLPGSAVDEAPVATIDTPDASLRWSGNDEIAFSGSAVDAEDGQLAAADLSWQVLLHHCSESDPTDCHIHAVESFDGVASGSFTAPDHDYPSYVELQLTATDSQGQTGSTSVELQPNTVNLTFHTDPSGLSLVVGNTADAAPITDTFIVGATTAISAPSPQTLGGTEYLFSAWDHGGGQSQTLIVPATDTTNTARYTQRQPPNETPVATIDTPDGATTWAVGDEISFSGSAIDAEDGQLAAADLSWQALSHHCSRTDPTDCHTHTEATFNGVASGSFVAPDHDYPTSLELRLTATDSGGLTDSVTVELQPRTVDLSFGAQPSGLELALNGDAAATPFSRTVIVGSTNTLTAPTPQVLGNTSYEFSAWSDGGEATHNITAPATATTYTATFEESSGLVAAYGFEEGTGTTTGDASGNGNDGTLQGAAWASGRTGGGLSFDGSDDLVTVADDASLDLSSQITLEAWVRPSSSAKGRAAALVKEATNGPVYALHASGSGGRASGSVATSGLVEATGPRLQAGLWAHIAVTYDGAKVQLYVDGQQAGSANTSGLITTSDGALRIGGTVLADEYFDGIIDDVRVYNRALSASEIATDMNTAVGNGGGTPSNPPPTAAISATCIILTCTFDGSGSNDDGTILDYAWNFGDGAAASGATAEHTYAADGTYDVQLTVTDDDGATDVAHKEVTVTALTDSIALVASGYKVKGVQHAELQWSGATGTVDVYRNGSIIATVSGAAYTDNIGSKGGGTYTYRVCEAGATDTCSNDVVVQF